MEEDMLQEIPNEDLSLLCELYKRYEQEAPHVCSTLNTGILWKKKKPNSNYLTFFGVNGDWLRTGTFVLLMQYGCYHLFIFTLEEDSKTLYEALIQTKKIDWTKQAMWYAISSRHVSIVADVSAKVKPPKWLTESVETGLWVIEKEKALEFDISCPDDVYIDHLNKSHIKLVNSIWPHRYEGSEAFLGTYVEMNNSYGIFLKSDDSLVCWVLKSHMGQMAILQTLPEHLRKGYATLITKVMAKEIAQEGYNPLGTIVTGNKGSELMYTKLGFRRIDTCDFILDLVT